MKTIKGSNEIKITTIGNIKWDDDNESLGESTVEMSERNFCLLLSFIPMTTEYQAVKQSLQYIKDKVTEMNFKTTAELNRSLLMNFLAEQLEIQKFYADVEAFNTKTKAESKAKIVGKIDLNDVV